MKVYIMLVDSIINMGGGQMYTSNKARYMVNKGWRVFVFSGRKGNVLIPELSPYSSQIVPEIRSAPMVFSKKTISRVLKSICRTIGEADEYVIESCSPSKAYWGELLAKALQCKHMIHLLNERNDKAVPEEYLDFFWFKHQRRELSGIKKASLRMLFRNSPEINDQNSYSLSSICQNTISDEVTEVKGLDIPKDGITIGCIGRLEKPYVMEAMKAIKELSDKYPEKVFNALIIGGTEEKRRFKQIQDVVKEAKNVRVLMPGYVYPIPKTLFGRVNVFISAAASANVSYKNGCTTISVDANDHKAIGVMGYTTQQSTYRLEEPQQEIADLLEKVLFTDYLLDYSYVAVESKVDLSRLEEHLSFLQASEWHKAYYDVMSLRVVGKDRKKWLIRLLIGEKGYLSLLR